MQLHYNAIKMSWQNGNKGLLLERIGTKAGRPRAPAETPREYAHALVPVLGDARLEEVGAALDRDAYSARGAPPGARASTEAVLTSLSS